VDKIQKLIAVSQRVDVISRRGEIRDCLDKNLTDWLESQGFLTVPVPNFYGSKNLANINSLSNWLFRIQPDALLLSGGNDIGQFPERDRTEEHLLTWAKRGKVPTLGICRGLQMMIAWSGGGLKKNAGHVGSRHKLQIHGEDLDWPSDVNSFHEWAIDSCTPEFLVAATSNDGSIEAVISKSLPWEGWMWHPERESPYNNIDRMRFQRLVNNVK